MICVPQEQGEVLRRERVLRRLLDSVSRTVVGRLEAGGAQGVETAALFPMMATLHDQETETGKKTDSMPQNFSSFSSSFSSGPSPPSSFSTPWLPRVLRVCRHYLLPPMEQRLFTWLIIKQTAQSFALREVS